MESECMRMAFKCTFMGFAVQCLSGHPLPADEREQGRPAVRDHRAGRRPRADHHLRRPEGAQNGLAEGLRKTEKLLHTVSRLKA